MNMALFADHKTLQLEAVAQTNRGQKRSLNEDAIFYQTGQTPTGEVAGLYLVCDGLGGHKAGDVASRLAIETITAELADLLFATESSNRHDTRPSSLLLKRYIQAAIMKANSRIRHYGQKHPQEAAKLGATITLALIYGDVVQIANVGDSRTYVYRSRQMIQLTQDHSLTAQFAKMGQIDESEIINHPQRNVLYRALGLQDNDDLEVDFFEWELQPGDRLLLCSDGLWQAFPGPTELGWWLGAPEPVNDICQDLVIEANRRDGSDNISAVVVDVSENAGWVEQVKSPVGAMFRVATLIS